MFNERYMRKRRRYARWLKMRTVALIVSTVLAFGGITGGTIAWLFSESSPVRNSFTPSKIAVTVSETDSDGDGDANHNTYQMLPGATIEKDPVVTFVGGSEKAWVFVKMEESANFGEFLSYEMAEGWTALDGVTGVYWREAEKSADDQTFDVIANNAVIVKADVTAAKLNTLTPATYPSLNVTAYAVQREMIDTPQAAYELVLQQRTNP